MLTLEMRFPSDLILKIVRCVEDAVGDDILADIQLNDLQTRNSVPARIWDLLNTNLLKALETENCTVVRAHRGPWQMLVIYEKTTHCIITFMREKRFADLCRLQKRRRRMHYVDMLAKYFNDDLQSDQQQISFYPHSFSDENRLAELVQDLLHELEGGSGVVHNHVLVLFETAGYQLSHIRAVMVTPSLEIAEGCEQNWTEFITAKESIVVSRTNDYEEPKNQPTHGLSLSQKAIARKKNKPQIRKPQEEQDKSE